MSQSGTQRRVSFDGSVVVTVFAVSAALMMTTTSLWRPRVGVVQQTAWSCAALSLFWSIVAAWSRRTDAVSRRSSLAEDSSFAHYARLAALLFGVSAAIVHAWVLIMRIVYVSVDLLRGYPWTGVRPYGFGADALFSLLGLLVSCVVVWRSTRDARLVTCGWWVTVVFASWTALLAPPFVMGACGAFERSGMTLGLLTGLAAVLLGTGIWISLTDRRAPRGGPESTRLAPGLAMSCGLLAVVILLLSCYHFLVPVRVGSLGWRGVCTLAALCSGAAGWAVFALVRSRWESNLADAAMGLASVSCCGVALVLVPCERIRLGDAYPMIFNAWMVGAALATGLWTYLSVVWRRPSAGDACCGMNVEWVSSAKRFAFLCAALALVAGALMTYWPRLPSIAGMDHSFSRVALGFGSYLFLLLMMLWSARRLQRLTFHLLTLIAVVSTAGFIVVRLMPFASRLG